MKYDHKVPLVYTTGKSSKRHEIKNEPDVQPKERQAKGEGIEAIAFTMMKLLNDRACSRERVRLDRRRSA